MASSLLTRFTLLSSLLETLPSIGISRPSNRRTGTSALRPPTMLSVQN
jgi:hypothetical protein